MEILIYIAVLAMLFLAVSEFLTWSIKLNAQARATRESTDNARRAMEIMVSEIRGAKSIYYPTSTTTQLSLETVKNLPEGEIFSFVDIYLCGEATSTICLKRESENPIAITSDRVRVNSLVFTWFATTTPSVKIQLVLDYNTQAQQPEYQSSVDLTSTASLRSY